MRITKVEFYGTSRDNFLRYAVIVLDNCMVVRGLKLIRRPDDSIFVAMPSRKKTDDTYEDVIHPINTETRRIMEKTVLAAWDVFPYAGVKKNVADIRK